MKITGLFPTFKVAEPQGEKSTITLKGFVVRLNQAWFAIKGTLNIIAKSIAKFYLKFKGVIPNSML